MKQGSRGAALNFFRRKHFGPPMFHSSCRRAIHLLPLKAAMAHLENLASSFLPTPPPVRRKSGPGCVVQVLAALVLGVVVLAGVTAIVAPWGFFMGGHFHLIPQWTGWGQMHSTITGDYALLVSFSPKTGKGLGLTHVSGNAVICTPRGERYKLRLGGDFGKASGTDLQGKSAHLYMNNYTVLSSSTAPSLEFRGKWSNPDLVLDDQGSLNRASDPGGALVTNQHMRPYMQEVVPLTLHEGSRADFDAACAALKAR